MEAPRSRTSKKTRAMSTPMGNSQACPWPQARAGSCGGVAEGEERQGEGGGGDAQAEQQGGAEDGAQVRGQRGPHQERDLQIEGADGVGERGGAAIASPVAVACWSAWRHRSISQRAAPVTARTTSAPARSTLVTARITAGWSSPAAAWAWRLACWLGGSVGWLVDGDAGGGEQGGQQGHHRVLGHGPGQRPRAVAGGGW